jgi:pimeloyl-ACP methyl ester carboxylesterase
VLLHGLASTCQIWEQAASILVGDYRVVAMDQRGHGHSAKPDHGYDFSSVGNDLMGLIEAKGLERPIVVGHSWGGDVALEFAVAHPEVTRGICLIDGGMIEPSVRYGSLADAREQMAPPIFTGVTLEEFVERIRTRRDPALMTPEFEAMILANFEVLEDNTIRSWLSRDSHLRIIDALWDHHPPQLFPKVECPALVLPARRDDSPEAAERNERRAQSVQTAVDALPKGEVVWLEDSVHDVPVQRPALVAGVIKEHIESGFFG